MARSADGGPGGLLTAPLPGVADTPPEGSAAGPAPTDPPSAAAPAPAGIEPPVPEHPEPLASAPSADEVLFGQGFYAGLTAGQPSWPEALPTRPAALPHPELRVSAGDETLDRSPGGEDRPAFVRSPFPAPSAVDDSAATGSWPPPPPRSAPPGPADGWPAATEPRPLPPPPAVWPPAPPASAPPAAEAWPPAPPTFAPPPLDAWSPAPAPPGTDAWASNGSPAAPDPLAERWPAGSATAPRLLPPTAGATPPTNEAWPATAPNPLPPPTEDSWSQGPSRPTAPPPSERGSGDPAGAGSGPAPGYPSVPEPPSPVSGLFPAASGHPSMAEPERDGAAYPAAPEPSIHPGVPEPFSPLTGPLPVEVPTAWPAAIFPAQSALTGPEPIVADATGPGRRAESNGARETGTGGSAAPRPPAPPEVEPEADLLDGLWSADPPSHRAHRAGRPAASEPPPPPPPTPAALGEPPPGAEAPETVVRTQPPPYEPPRPAAPEPPESDGRADTGPTGNGYATGVYASGTGQRGRHATGRGGRRRSGAAKDNIGVPPARGPLLGGVGEAPPAPATASLTIDGGPPATAGAAVPAGRPPEPAGDAPADGDPQSATAQPASPAYGQPDPNGHPAPVGQVPHQGGYPVAGGAPHAVAVGPAPEQAADAPADGDLRLATAGWPFPATAQSPDEGGYPAVEDGPPDPAPAVLASGGERQSVTAGRVSPAVAPPPPAPAAGALGEPYPAGDDGRTRTEGKVLAEFPPGADVPKGIPAADRLAALLLEQPPGAAPTGGRASRRAGRRAEPTQQHPRTLLNRLASRKVWPALLALLLTLLVSVFTVFTRPAAKSPTAQAPGKAPASAAAVEGPVVTVRGARDVIVGHSKDAVLLRAVAAETDRDVDRVTDLWGTKWARRVTVILPATDAEFTAVTAGHAPETGIAAVALLGEPTAALIPGSDAEALSRAGAGQDRIVLQPTAFRKLSALGRRVVLRHEITHVATEASTTASTPDWLAEGLAETIGWADSEVKPPTAAPELAAEVKAGRLPAALPDAKAFTAAGARLPALYQESWLACQFIVDKVGIGNLVRLYQAVGAAPARAAGGAVDTLAGAADARQSAALQFAFAVVLRVSPQLFVHQWRQYVAAELT